jgi:hypothetical protein
MRTAIVIPARYASRRLPGKPLLCETGKYLIQHVYEQACQCRRAEQGDCNHNFGGAAGKAGCCQPYVQPPVTITAFVRLTNVVSPSLLPR